MSREMTLARAATLRTEGLDNAEKSAKTYLRKWWPARHTFAGKTAIRCNIQTIRDCRTLRAVAS